MTLIASALLMAALVVDGNVPAGNIVVEKIEGDTVRLSREMRDSKGNWFYWAFRVKGAERRTLKFVFDPKICWGGPVGVRGPAVTTDGGKTWCYPCDGTSTKNEFAYTFDSDDEVRFYETWQYLPSEWDAFLARHAAERGKKFVTGVLCKSRKGRDVPNARFGCLGGNPQYRIFMSSRHHCSEATATPVLEGVAASFLADDDLGRWLCANVELMLVPFVDYDGVIAGDQGKNRAPHDHNRDYTEFIYPETRAIRDWIGSHANGRLDVFIDVHCPWIRDNTRDHAKMSNEFLYTPWKSPEILPNPALEKRFSELLEELQCGSMRYRASDDVQFGRLWNTTANFKAGKPSVAWACTAVKGLKIARTYEVPFAVANGAVVTPQSCRDLGRDTAKVFRALLVACGGRGATALPCEGGRGATVLPCEGGRGATALPCEGGPGATARPCVGTALAVDGIYPHLAMQNDEGECGIGAVVPWAGSLWVVTYGPHCPCGSSDKLYEIKPDLTRVVRAESVGGTHANRMIHRESNQLLIGPYVIDANGKVRVVPAQKMPGRLTGAARHLTDPAKRVYVATMETGLYELDMDTLSVRTLIRENGMNDGAIAKHVARTGGVWPQGWDSAPVTRVPGYHGKGLSSGFGRVYVANNGENSAAARKNPFVPSGVLADWSAFGKDWRTIRRCQFTEIATADGIYGNEHPKTNPIWSLGWDAKSVILAVTTNGATWTYYRLPKASHCYDGAHGWNTEWPRIREAGLGGGDLLATMHGTFWRFPKGFSPATPNGIRPISTYLKVIGDFCYWKDAPDGGAIVFGCDDHAKNQFLGTRKLKSDQPPNVRSTSNLWFVKPEDLATFGPPSGEGWVWYGEDVKAGDVSDPYLWEGYAEREFAFTDAQGNPVAHELIHEGDWVRVKALADAKGVKAHFIYGPAQVGRSGIGPDRDGQAGRSGIGPDRDGCAGRSVIGPDRDGCADRSGIGPDRDGQAGRSGIGPYRDGADGRDRAPRGPLSPITITDDNGRVFCFPNVNGDTNVICREVATERDLLYVGGVFYEVPAENAGGFACLRPVALADEPVKSVTVDRGLIVVNGKRMVLDSLWKNGTAAEAYWLWRKCSSCAP